MSKRFRNSLVFFSILCMVGFFFFKIHTPTPSLPLITIAYYGLHASLDETIQGIKKGLELRGYKENEGVAFKVAHVNFDPSLIPQMISNMRARKPKVMVALTTPVAQALKNTEKQLPIVFAAITNPVEAGLIQEDKRAHKNLTGSSDKQDLDLFLTFAKELLPRAQSVGILYATGEANDHSLVTSMKRACQKVGLHMVAIPMDQTRDIPHRMQGFKSRVDFIYVGTSGPIQPALPTIVAEADRMNIPVFNADSEAVKNNQVLGSYGVTYARVGMNAGTLIADLMDGKEVADVPPVGPSFADHQGFVSRRQAEKFGIHSLPLSQSIVIVEKIMLCLSNLVKSYEDSLAPTLQGITLDVKEGEFCIVIGGNGSGKSTLLKAISGEHLIDSGKITLGAREISLLSLTEKAKIISCVTQEVTRGTIAEMTVFENMVLSAVKGKKGSLSFYDRHSDHLKGHLQKIKLSLEDYFNRPLGCLSGGQRQVVCTLMAFLSNPKLLLLDEHTSALDSKTQNSLMHYTAQKIKEEKITTLMVTHNLQEALNYGTRLLVMDQGRIVLDLKGKAKDCLDLNALKQMMLHPPSHEFGNGGSKNKGSQR